MSRLIDSIIQTLPAERLARRPSLVAVHAFFTVVRSWRLGLAMTLTDDAIYHGGVHRPVRHMGEMETRPLAELVTWTASDQPIERSVGMAALNSALPLAGLPFREGNALDLTARLGAGRQVVVVGHFPHLETVRAAARQLHILEKRPQPGDLPAEAAPQVVPEADVITMTGVTCLNDTVEGLLALKRPGAICIMLGPTVPISPVLFEAGVDVIGGAWVDDERVALPMMAQGATARVLRGLRNVLTARDPRLLEGLPVIVPPPEIAS
ncbi:MAG: Molybdenum transport ATP-binding protein ModC [Candidatus Ozemobacter sibiricus]|uniref:Molybdenum transport ATP-binding protein ModC n=1 Tax=Candidatus Ozemobacter sibiricus TaxID=2268124 RepID=A0A367ZSE4_9BACT|nr:MAG: Molybdenum transport ATP-binding protein ModC [Candidatus Ozemobacter sibiricus]